MKRTAMLHSLELNSGKFEELDHLVRAYAMQKDVFLVQYAHLQFLDRLKSNKIRDELVKTKFKSPSGLKARAWKRALVDALQTIDMYWQSAIEFTRKYACRRFSDAQRHYALWCLKSYLAIQAIMIGSVPIQMPKKCMVSEEDKMQVVIFLRRNLRKQLGNRPRVDLKRSVCLDANMYRSFEESGTQYISISKLSDKGLMPIPLKGHHAIKGNIRIILDRFHHTLEVHVAGDLIPASALKGPSAGVDLGISEIFVDNEGTKWCSQFWDDLKTRADQLNENGQQRNKIHAMEKELRKTDPTKAHKIRKFNLGKDKLIARKERFQGMIETNVNTAINQFLALRQPSRVAIEDLSHYRPPSGKGWWSRQASIWVRQIVNDRFKFKLQAGGSSLESVNAAYSSQTCSVCGYLDPLNRRGDVFKCRNCGVVLDADTNASRNLENRLDDPEIRTWMRKEQVRAILVNRFEKRRLEGQEPCGSGLTVSGMTPGTVMSEVQRERSTGERNYGGGVRG
jgi:putative transposase